MSPAYNAGLAVDGFCPDDGCPNKSANFNLDSGGSLAISGNNDGSGTPDDPASTWFINLAILGTCTITDVLIYTRQDDCCTDRIDTAEVFLVAYGVNPLFNQAITGTRQVFLSPVQPSQTFDYNSSPTSGGTVAQYVVVRQTTFQFLELAEVVVNGSCS